MTVLARAGTSTAIVHAADGVRFVATAPCAEELFARVAEYVRARCDDGLWFDAAMRVRTLLDSGKLQAAITLYFTRVGERWDEEQLDVVTMERAEYWMPPREQAADATH